MVISLTKHLCPGTGVEAACIAMQGNHNVPTWIVDRIENPHLQRFLVRLRLYQGILAREGAASMGCNLAGWRVFKGCSLGERSLTNRFADAASDILDLFCG